MVAKSVAARLRIRLELPIHHAVSLKRGARCKLWEYDVVEFQRRFVKAERGRVLRNFTVHTRFEIGLIDAQGAFSRHERDSSIVSVA